MRTLYSFAIRIYVLLIRLSSFHNKKAKEWLTGRRNYWIPLKAAIPFDKPIVWFHAASLGEFEQGRPVIEAFRETHKDIFIILTFFSPSGYEIHKNYTLADYVTYIQPDTLRNARKFIRIVHPELAFFIKYEFWFNHLYLLKLIACRTYLISGIFRPSQHFFKPWGKWFRNELKSFTYFFLQDEQSAELLNSIGLTNHTVNGDTRFDRVLKICNNALRHQDVEVFCQNRKVIIGGSTWDDDEKALHSLYKGIEELFFIIAPHEVHESRLLSIEALFTGDTCRLSAMAGNNTPPNSRVLIIDSIGVLSGIYRYGWLALIGGGFGRGIHNILEAACFGLPVVFGPNYGKFREANELIGKGAAMSFTETNELLLYIKKLLSSSEEYQKKSDTVSFYVKSKAGATDLIINHLSSGRAV